MYYDDILFINIILNKIFNPIKQLHLNLTGYKNITDVSALGNVHTLILPYSFMENTGEISELIL